MSTGTHSISACLKSDQGDINVIDIPKRSITLKVDDGVLAQRRAAWKKPAPKITRGWLGRYARLVTSASKGAVLTLPE